MKFQDSKAKISTLNAPPPAGTYSQGIVANGFLFIAGQGPFDLSGNKCPDTFRNEVLMTLNNLESIATAAGTTIQNAVRLGVYLLDMNNFKEMNSIFVEYFKEPYPVRTTIQADLRGFQIEIDAIVKI